MLSWGLFWGPALTANRQRPASRTSRLVLFQPLMLCSLSFLVLHRSPHAAYPTLRPQVTMSQITSFKPDHTPSGFPICPRISPRQLAFDALSSSLITPYGTHRAALFMNGRLSVIITTAA